MYVSSCTIPEQCGQDILLGYQVVSQGGHSEQLGVGSGRQQVFEGVHCTQVCNSARVFSVVCTKCSVVCTKCSVVCTKCIVQHLDREGRDAVTVLVVVVDEILDKEHSSNRGL